MARPKIRRRHEKTRRHVPVSAETSAIVREAEYVERLAYRRSQAAEALGISRSTFIRRVLPYIETIEMPWGATLIPCDELERVLAERRRAARAAAEPGAPGRPPLVTPEVVERIRRARRRKEPSRDRRRAARRRDTDRTRRRAMVAVNRPRSPAAPSVRRRCGTVFVVSESLQVTIVFEEGEDGWIVASIPEVPGAHSQGRTREEARTNVIDALRGILELRFGEHREVTEGADSEPLELVIGA
jgi:predicted RNase H-like HicB family nuclease